MDFQKFKDSVRKFKDTNVFEFNRVMSAVAQNTSADSTILDVGSGFGRYLKPLSALHKQVVGVEANDKTARMLKKEGYTVYSPEEFQKVGGSYDVVLMSHFIEHFGPDELLEVMETYLDYLKVGGILIIATPVLSETFYINFDHVRPYYPQSIEEVFGGKGQEVQYYARNKLNTERVWYRRSRLQILQTSMLYNNEITKNLCYLINVLLSLLFRLSFSLIGYRSGWIGVFRKV
jgi:SAM-dependent methyltransferase